MSGWTGTTIAAPLSTAIGISGERLRIGTMIRRYAMPWDGLSAGEKLHKKTIVLWGGNDRFCELISFPSKISTFNDVLMLIHRDA